MMSSIPHKNESTVRLSQKIRNFFSCLAATGFTLTILLLLLAMVILIDQTKDIIHQLNSEMAAGVTLKSFFRFVGAFICMLWLSLMCWWSARFIFDKIAHFFENYGNPAMANNFTKVGFVAWLPRIYAATPGVIVCVGGIIQSLWPITILGAIAAIFSLTLVTFRHRLADRYVWAGKVFTKSSYWTYIAIFICAVLSFFSVFYLYPTSELLGAFYTMMLGLASLLFGMTYAVYSITKLVWKLPFIGPVIEPPVQILTLSVLFAILISFVWKTDNHGIRRCLTSADADLEVQCASKQPEYSHAFTDLSAAWKKFTTGLKLHYGDRSQDIPVFFVASQGGGLRASYWTALVLSELEKQIPGFHRNIFVLTGVSGGSVGNTFYVAALDEARHAEPPYLELQQRLKNSLGRDYLSAVTTSFFYNDLMFRFLPLQFDPYQQDRAEVLERSWEQGFVFDQVTATAGLSAQLQQFYRPVAEDKTTWLPLLLSVGAHQEAGVTVLTAPFRIQTKDFPASYDLYQLMGCDHPESKSLSCDVKLSTTALNAARFPFLTPAGSLDYDLRTGLTSQKYKHKSHLIDGGYLDNFGAATVQQLIESLNHQQEFAKKAGGPRFVPVVLLITNDPELSDSLMSENRYQPAVVNSWIANELLSPLQGIISARSGQSDSAFRRLFHWQNQQSTHFGSLFHDPNYPNLQNTLVFRLPTKLTTVPLGWWLSENARSQMNHEIGESNNKEIVKTIQRVMPDVVVP